MRARVQTEWFNVVFVRSGPGPDRTRLVPSRREELAQRAARWPVCQSVKVSVSQAGSLSVSLSVRVGLLGKTATSRQSAADRSVGEVRESRAVKRVSNGASDMMTEAEGVERGAAVGGRVVVIEGDGRRPVVATGLRLSCDTAATVPTHSLRLYLFCCSLQTAVCGLRSAAGGQGERGRASPRARRRRSAGQARRRTGAMDGFLTEADDADQRRAADGELGFQRRLVVGTIGKRAIDATQAGQSVRRDIKAGVRTAGRRAPRNVDRRVGQLATAQASSFWGSEADCQPRSSSKQQR